MRSFIKSYFSIYFINIYNYCTIINKKNIAVKVSSASNFEIKFFDEWKLEKNYQQSEEKNPNPIDSHIKEYFKKTRQANFFQLNIIKLNSTIIIENHIKKFIMIYLKFYKINILEENIKFSLENNIFTQDHFNIFFKKELFIHNILEGNIQNLYNKEKQIFNPAIFSNNVSHTNHNKYLLLYFFENYNDYKTHSINIDENIDFYIINLKNNFYYKTKLSQVNRFKLVDIMDEGHQKIQNNKNNLAFIDLFINDKYFLKIIVIEK